MMHISQLQELSGNVQEMSPTYRFSHHMIPTLPVLRKCARHTKFPVCMKCHLSCFQIFSFMPESAYMKCKGYVLEMSCVLTTGNVPEISCVLVQEMCLKFCPILHQERQGNVKISWCRKCTRNVNFPGHFMGFPCPGYLVFLPM